MAGEPGWGLQEQRPAGDGLGVLAGMGQPDEQAPPVIRQGGDPGHQVAALEVTGGEATPAPVVLEFIKRIIRIGAVAIPLGEGQDFLLEGSDQDGVCVDDHVIGQFGEGQAQLGGIALVDHGQIAFDLAPQDDG